MSKTYAIADLHGRHDLLLSAFDTIRSHTKEQPCNIVLLGDYVDRGPQSRQIIETLMAPPPDGCNVICLKGNHEAMMVECLTGKARMSWWIGNGGGATLVSYGQKQGEAANPNVVPAKHVKWLDDLPRFHVDDYRTFVHAGVEDGVPLAEHTDEIALWKLYRSNDEGGYFNTHVVHGHHQFENGPIIKTGRTDLDTFSWYTGRLVVGVFDNDVPGGPVEILEVIGLPAFLPEMEEA